MRDDDDGDDTSTGRSGCVPFSPDVLDGCLSSPYSDAAMLIGA